MLLFSFLLGGCSSGERKREQQAEEVQFRCEGSMDSLQKEHLAMAIKSGSTFRRCLINYMRLEKTNEADFRFCTYVKVNRSGRVQSVYLTQSNLPKSLHWCIEQEIWSKSFLALQLNRTVSVHFPVKLHLRASE